MCMSSRCHLDIDVSRVRVLSVFYKLLILRDDQPQDIYIYLVRMSSKPEVVNRRVRLAVHILSQNAIVSFHRYLSLGINRLQVVPGVSIETYRDDQTPDVRRMPIRLPLSSRHDGWISINRLTESNTYHNHGRSSARTLAFGVRLGSWSSASRRACSLCNVSTRLKQRASRVEKPTVLMLVIPKHTR